MLPHLSALQERECFRDVEAVGLSVFANDLDDLSTGADGSGEEEGGLLKAVVVHGLQTASARLV